MHLRRQNFRQNSLVMLGMWRDKMVRSINIIIYYLYSGKNLTIYCYKYCLWWSLMPFTVALTSSRIFSTFSPKIPLDTICRSTVKVGFYSNGCDWIWSLEIFLCASKFSALSLFIISVEVLCYHLHLKKLTSAKST